MSRVGASVRESLDRMYEPQPAGCTLVFTEPKPAHDDVIKRVLYQPEHSNQHFNNESDSDADEKRSFTDSSSKVGNVNDGVMAGIGKRDEPDDDRSNESLISDILNSIE